MVRSIDDPIWENILKNKVKFVKKDFLINVFLFVVRKSYETQKITLEQAKRELFDFFAYHSKTYDLDKLITKQQ